LQEKLPNYEPSYSSVAPVIGGVSPPKAKAAVCIPQPAKWYLAVFNPVGLEVVQLEFHHILLLLAVIAGVTSYSTKT
jgi:hypothetical protein